ncbi:hypothetical protein [Actinobacillus equuli]|uniref:hypothetical protein n=2 Tax=Actinobacillus equuli TaxID=718 RepID=UPI002441A4EC|nr:hypothetical protein [Actinobacillus equuli]WGE74251.1 hypothetical protein NYR80_04435 [Actinobacillus equuli subsp. haemolyticus]WGE86465.1 hypothetical protein NYR87_04485 [Actinobacillus equuli subsp. haemolyticus]
MRRIIYLILLLWSMNLNANKDSAKESSDSILQGYCLLEKQSNKESMTLQIFINSDNCQYDNYAKKSIVRFVFNKGNNKIVKSTTILLPAILPNNELSFEGERELLLDNEFLLINIAPPNRVLAEAYGFSFIFKINGDNISFYDYTIYDLCGIPEDNHCPRAELIKEDVNEHKLAREMFYGESIFDFDTNSAFEKIFNLWQGTGVKKVTINIEKAYLYRSPNNVSKKYLIKDDEITILNEKTDNSGQKWYFINYKGKKDINMWIKAEAVDLK